MDLSRHEFELDDLVERIKKNDTKLVALQVPEGLKMQALEMMDQIETETSARVVLSADPCYGACDLVHDKMQNIGVELVAHMGHSQMNIDSGMPTQFIPVTYDGSPEIAPVIPYLNAHRKIAFERMNNPSNPVEDELEAIEKFQDMVGRIAPLTDTKLGLVGSIQHLHLLPTYKKYFEEAGFEVTIPVGGARLSFPGQVLGCNYSGDDPTVGHYIFLGSGDFHPIGLVLHTGKPLAMLDPYTGEATEMGRERIERILRQRSG
ncbi:MAG: diphthamide synthesis protein, partial [Candidatus Thermoplasmatota archaeon]|nr:diphthamide synthesis protein [Candidatus Thermoplasmatota archaeon]